MLVEFVQWDPCDVTKFEILKVKTPLRFWLCLVRVKAFPENILFSGNAIFRKGK